MKYFSECQIEKLLKVDIVFFDFDGVFTDNSVYISEKGIETVRCSRLDGIGLSKLKAIGVKPIIISSEVNLVVAARSKKLNVQCYQSVADKGKVISEICAQKKVHAQNQIFVGNDVNDIPAFKTVGCSVAVNDYFLDIEAHVQYKTFAMGGYGAVREVCDVIFQARSNG